MDREPIIRRGKAAEVLLADSNVMQALGELEADLVTEWAGTNPDNTTGREAIWRQVKSLEMFQAKLESWRDNGKLEEANAERDRKDRQGMQIEA